MGRPVSLGAERDRQHRQPLDISHYSEARVFGIASFGAALLACADFATGNAPVTSMLELGAISHTTDRTGATFISPSFARNSGVRPGKYATGVNSAIWQLIGDTPI